MQCEVHWEHVLLKGGKLSARQGTEGNDTADERLKDGGAKESAITKLEVRTVIVGVCEKADLRR